MLEIYTGPDDDSGKMLSLQKEADRNLDSSLSDNFTYILTSAERYEKAKGVFETIGENGMLIK